MLMKENSKGYLVPAEPCEMVPTSEYERMLERIETLERALEDATREVEYWRGQVEPNFRP